MNDDEFLELLRGKVGHPPEVSPSPAGLEALRRALMQDGPAVRTRRRGRRRWAIPVLTTGVLLGGTVGAMAATGIPEPVREAARLVRLPVPDRDRPSMADLVTRLRSDRAHGETRAAARDARDLEGRLRAGDGSPSDRAEADQALEEGEQDTPEAHETPGGTNGQDQARPTADVGDREPASSPPGTETSEPPATTEAPAPHPEPATPTSEPPSTGATSEPTSAAPTSEPPSAAPTSEPPSAAPTSEPPSPTPESEPPSTPESSGRAH